MYMVFIYYSRKEIFMAWDLKQIRDKTFGVVGGITGATIGLGLGLAQGGADLVNGKSLEEAGQSVNKATEKGGEIGAEFAEKNAEFIQALALAAMATDGLINRHNKPNPPKRS
jgi:hypothetical protein